MDQLFVIRHGIAVRPGTPDLEDDARPLTDKGIRRTRQVARALAKIGVHPDRIYTSPLPRAWQTAEIVASSLKCPDRVETTEQLVPGAGCASIRDWLLQLTDRRVLIVGHNPHLQHLVSLLIAPDDQPSTRLSELRKGGVAALARRDGPDFELQWYVPPRILRRIGN